jgi:hypothetical protein
MPPYYRLHGQKLPYVRPRKGGRGNCWSFVGPFCQLIFSHRDSVDGKKDDYFAPDHVNLGL